jgi:hypothetical protein
MKRIYKHEKKDISQKLNTNMQRLVTKKNNNNKTTTTKQQNNNKKEDNKKKKMRTTKKKKKKFAQDIRHQRPTENPPTSPSPKTQPHANTPHTIDDTEQNNTKNKKRIHIFRTKEDTKNKTKKRSGLNTFNFDDRMDLC